MVETVLIPNAIAMVLLSVLLFSVNRVSRHTLLMDSKIFVLMIICNFLQCIGEIIAYSIDGIAGPGFRVFGLVVNSALYIVNIFFAFLWVMYADYKIYEDIERLKTRSKKLMIPALLIILASVVNLFVPVFFKITQDNQYQRTSLYFISYLVTYFYLLYGTVFIYKHKNQAKKYVFLPAVLFMLPILLGSVIQYFFKGISTIWAGVAIALAAVYINVQNEVSYTDALSGLYTRIYMYQYLETALRKKSQQKRIAGFMLDIDDFKQINDTHGHLTGDDAIRSAGIILYDKLADSCIVSRYGGDEFVVLRQIQSDEDIEKTLEQITKAETDFNKTGEKNYSIHFSKGYSILDTEIDTVDSFLERIDHAMYEAKKTHRLNKGIHSERQTEEKEKYED